MDTKSRLLHTVGKIPLVGTALRRMARRYPEGSVVTIGAGLVKGLKWKRYHRHLSAYWLGHYEIALQEAVARELRMGGVFYDVGANAGFFSAFAARIAGETGRVVAFDPLDENCSSVREQLEINGYVARAAIRKEAVSDSIGSATFNVGGEGDLMGKLGAPREHQTKTITVPTVTLDSVLLTGERRPTLLKVDVEGAEAAVLRGAAKLFEAPLPCWIIEIHGDEVGEEVRLLMKERYQFFELHGAPLPEGAKLPHHVIAKGRQLSV